MTQLFVSISTTNISLHILHICFIIGT